MYKGMQKRMETTILLRDQTTEHRISSQMSAPSHCAALPGQASPSHALCPPAFVPVVAASALLGGSGELGK